MFEDRMKTPAIPERVFALCSLLRNRDRLDAEVKELLEPAHLGGNTRYYGIVKTAAIQLGLVSVRENIISLAVDKSEIESIDSMRRYIIKNISKLKNSLFYEVTGKYYELGDNIYKFKSVSDKEMIEWMTMTLEKSVYEDDMRAWRFWASFLGLGHLHNMLILPNAYSYILDVINILQLEKNKEYSFESFMQMAMPYFDIILKDLKDDKKLNMAFSSGLRALHDNEKVKLKHKLDRGDMWFLYPSEVHSIKSTITHITIRG